MNETDTVATKPRSLKAIISLVLGFDAFIFLVILFPFSVIFGIIGLWTGIKALKDINNYHYRGRKAALAGVIFSLIGTIMGAIITLNVFVL
ncbi:DUF4190 domain-containing protein [Marinococcus luteus]|uniref:DUF4190 domain-containing protein n=1 Tax=Marinococcus luteus TaxID=1122204 RepID=UPI002ACD0E17|nr:DUF4190 domain-containing protein [Marinococcus luteus]MDZ5782542.1 DUF4190 domain-containing protein [Marinococcus luteus]